MSQAKPSLASRISTFFAARLWAKILLFAVVGLPPLLGVTIGPLALMLRANAEIKSSDAYRRSLELARESPRLRAALGEPIEPSYWTAGMMMEGEDRYTSFRYQVTGPKGAATIEVDADYDQNVFTLRKVKAETDPTLAFVELWPASDDDSKGDAPEADGASGDEKAEASAQAK